MKKITVKVRFDELPDPVRKDFLLEEKEREIHIKKISPVLKKTFVDSETLTFNLPFNMKRND